MKFLRPVPQNPHTESIMREAWDLFQQKGYRGVSVNEICRRCRISKPTLYYYFGEKETLFIQVLLHQLAGYRAVLEAPGVPEERLTNLAAHLLATFTTDIAGVMHDMEHITNPAYHELMNQAFRDELFGPIVAVMCEGMEQGSLREDDPNLFAWAYLGLVNTFSGHFYGLAADREAMAKRLVAFFFAGAQAQPAGSLASTHTSTGDH